MDPDTPENERQRKIDEAVESGNHELREMARLAYNRGDKELARNIWRSLTDSDGDDDKVQSSGVSATHNNDPDTPKVPDQELEVARQAAADAESSELADVMAVYASADAKVEDSLDSAPAVFNDAVTGGDAGSMGAGSSADAGGAASSGPGGSGPGSGDSGGGAASGGPELV